MVITKFEAVDKLLALYMSRDKTDLFKNAPK